MNTLLLSRKDIEGIIDFESAYAAARDAYKAFSSGKVVQPPIDPRIKAKYVEG